MSNSDRQKFHWKGLDLHLGRGKVPVLTLVADATYPHLYRIKYPNGWTSTPANLTRAKDAAYGHARHLLWGQTRDVVRQAADPPSTLYPPQYRPIAASLALGGCAGTSPSGCLREGRHLQEQDRSASIDDRDEARRLLFDPDSPWARARELIAPLLVSSRTRSSKD